MHSLTKTALSLAALAALMSPAAPSKAEESGKSIGGKNETFSAALSDKELDKTRGRFTSPNLMFSTLSATLEGNSAEGTISGSNGISDSFNNITGLTTVIQNSGNNVIVQSSTMVSVNFVEPPQPPTQ